MTPIGIGLAPIMFGILGLILLMAAIACSFMRVKWGSIALFILFGFTIVASALIFTTMYSPIRYSANAEVISAEEYSKDDKDNVVYQVKLDGIEAKVATTDPRIENNVGKITPFICDLKRDIFTGSEHIYSCKINR